MAIPSLTSAIEAYARDVSPADVNVSLWLPTPYADVLELLLVWPARPRRKSRSRAVRLTFEALMRGDWRDVIRREVELFDEEVECAAQR